MSIKEKMLKAGAPGHVAEQLATMGWDKVVELENGGGLLFPAKLQRMKGNGEFESIDVCLRVPREPDLRKARVMARRMAEEQGLDMDRDKDLIDNFETMCILADAIRNPSPMRDGVHEPFDPFPEQLEQHYDRQSLAAIHDLLDWLSELLNPNPQQISEDEMLVVIGMIAKNRSIAPLAVYGQDAQNSLLVTMADRLVSFMERKSSPDASEPSTPD